MKLRLLAAAMWMLIFGSSCAESKPGLVKEMSTAPVTPTLSVGQTARLWVYTTVLTAEEMRQRVNRQDEATC